MNGTLKKASLANCNLEKSDLRSSDLTEAVLRDANLAGANLSNALLTRSNISRALFNAATLRSADLRMTNAVDAVFHLAILHLAKLDEANITGAYLWETQRTGWSIANIRCESAYWDEGGVSATIYAPGEFEKLFGQRLTVELFYEDGITSFEFDTFPALLHRLSDIHRGHRFSMSSLVEVSGGALVTIRLEGEGDVNLAGVKADAEEFKRLQTALRDSNREFERVNIEKSLLLSEVFPRLVQAVGGNSVNITGPSHGLAISVGNASIALAKSENTHLDQLLELVGEMSKLISNSTESDSVLSAELLSALERAQGSLAEQPPQASFVSNAFKTVRSLASKVIVSSAGSVLQQKLGPLADQLEHLLKAWLGISQL